jgi:hypothetical protein
MIPIVGTLAGGLCFGVADRWLAHGPAWTLDVSNVAALWLAIAFVAGLSCSSPALGSISGFVAVQSALVGYYGWMFVFEHVTPASYLLVRAAPWAIATLVVGPLFGWLGCRWKVERSNVAVLALAAAFVIDCVGYVAIYGIHTWVNLVVHLAAALTGCLIVSCGFLARRATPPAQRIPLQPPSQRPRTH